MKKRMISIVSAACFWGVLLLVSPSGVFADTMTFKVSSYDVEQHYLTQFSWMPYLENIEKRSNDRITFKAYHGGTIAKAHQAYDAVKNGVVDIVTSAALFTQESRFPVSTVLSLPFLYNSSLQANRVYYDAIRLIPEIRAEYKDVKVLWVHMTDMVNISTSSPAPKELEDLKGLKLWGGSKSGLAIIKALGATPRVVKLEDLFTSLQRKALDGAFFPTAPLAAWKLTDVLNHHTVLMAQPGLMPAMMNKRSWEKLPVDIRDMFADQGLGASEIQGALLENRRAYVFKQLKARGDEIYELPEAERARWREATQPVYDEWLANMRAKGIDGQRILDDVIALTKKYQSDDLVIADWVPENWKK